MKQTEGERQGMDEIPPPGEKLLSEYGKGTFSIGEVASMLGVHTHTIRFWEKTFRIVIPRKESNRRRYTLADITLLKKIQRLVHKDRLSLNTARCQLEAEGVLPPEALGEDLSPQDEAPGETSPLQMIPDSPLPAVTGPDDLQPAQVMESVARELRAVVELLKTVSGKH